MRIQSTDPTAEPSRGPQTRRARRAWAVLATLAAVLLLASCSDPVPSAGAATMSLLFVQNTTSGTFQAAAGARDGELRLTGVSPSTTWFSDRPVRKAGVQSTESVTAEWDAFGFGASPPNAALVLDGLPASANTVIVELQDPRYDAAAHELRYRVHVLDEARDGLAGAKDRATPQIPMSFGAANLFIDDASVTAETTTGSTLRGTAAPQTTGTGTVPAPTTTSVSPTTTPAASPTTAPSSVCSSTLATFAAAAQAGTYTSPAQSIAFPTPVTLQNPATQGSTTASQTVSIPFVAYDANGSPVSPTASAPLTVSIYGAPAGSIQTTPAGTGTSPVVVTVTSGSALSLTYNGAYLNRPVTVAASLPLSTTNVCTNTPEFAIGSTSLALATVPTAVGTVSYSTPTVCSGSTTGSACAMKNVDSDGLRLSATVGYGAAVPGSTAAATTPTGFANYTVDTGSIGTALPKTELGPDAIGPGGPALKYYDSSGNEFAGYVYLAPVTLQMGSVQVTTDPIRVLAVMSSDCHPNKTCTGPPPFADFHYLGVGLDRSLGTAADPFGSPRDNALLSVGSTSGTLSPGYVLSGSSIQVGITASNATSSVVPLTANTTDPGDWNAMPMCVTFPTAGATSPAPTCGSLLMDVGIPEMFITFGSAADEPAAVSGGLADNQTISIAAPNQTSPALAYSFSSGPAGGATPPATGEAPSKVVLGVIAGPTKVFINTGRHVLFGYQYVFNAQAGTVGFIPLNPPLR